MPKEQAKPAPAPQQPHQDPDFQKRIEACNKEMEPLLKKHELALMGVPLITPDGRLTATVVFVTTRERVNLAKP